MIGRIKRGLSATFFDLSIIPAVPWNRVFFYSMPKPSTVILHLLAVILSRLSPQCWAYTRVLQREKSISPPFPGPLGTVFMNDWCIGNGSFNVENCVHELQKNGQNIISRKYYK